MKVFVSWSGEPSHSVALVLREWLELVFAGIEPYVSSEDIAKGKRWPHELGQNLEQVDIGILCLTPQNKAAPWILFEAGALSKSLENAQVIPLLIGLDSSAVEWPLAQFQLTRIQQDDVGKMVKSINNAWEQPRQEAALLKVFDRFWPDLEEGVANAVAAHSQTNSAPTSRTDREVLEEILELVRGQQRMVRQEAPLSQELQDYVRRNYESFGLLTRAKPLPDEDWMLKLRDLATHPSRELEAVLRRQVAEAAIEQLRKDGKIEPEVEISNVRVHSQTDGTFRITYDES